MSRVGPDCISAALIAWTGNRIPSRRVPIRHRRRPLLREPSRLVYSPEEMKVALTVFSLLSQSGSSIKNALYDRGLIKPRRAPIPVISVGNISLGGTEKTPLAMELLARLSALGRRPALVSRGYKGRWEKTGGILSDGRSILGTWQDGGDEPYLIARTHPAAGVYVGKDRLASCRRAATAGFDIVVLDDGFQHRRLARDVDIVLHSLKGKTGLRESLSALCRADIVLIKSGDEGSRGIEWLRHRANSRLFTYSVVARAVTDIRTGERVPAEKIAKTRFLAFCGIARPSRFLETLRQAGLQTVSLLPFPDHHPYPSASLKKINRAGRSRGATALITTAKDAVKLAGRVDECGEIPVYTLEIGLALEPGFEDCWRGLLEKRTGQCL